MHTRNGRSHRRFEFMLLPGERPEDFADAGARVGAAGAVVHARPTACIVRHAVYEFRGRLAETMRAGRVLLAGDAAHTMPPFMGQGLCSGVRDAANLAWRLDLVLRGVADERLLDGYTAERSPQNEWIVNLSTEMGRVSCTLDPQAAAERDAALRAADAPPPLALPPLQDGTLAAGRPLAGSRAVQGARPRSAGREGRFDDVVGKRFVLLTRRAGRPARRRTWSSWSASARDVVALDGARGPRRPADRLARRARPRGRARSAPTPTSSAPPRRSTTSPRWSTTCAPTCPSPIRGSPPMSADPVIHPKFHHVNLKTTRLQEMIDWYSTRGRHRGPVPVRRSGPGRPTTRPTTGSR